MTPAPEKGVERLGASVEFLENAEEYYERFQQYEYWKGLLETAIASAPVGDVRTIVEYGCGFGNATLPALELFPDAKIVASDISPNLLAILNRLLVERNEQDRCVAVAFDAHKPYLREGVADLVLGSAILHHLVEPDHLITATSRVLRPGGLAVFFEPMEAGYAVLRLVIRDICQEAAIREFASPALTWLAELAADWLNQITRDGSDVWRARDDKWLFSRSVLERYAEQAGLDLILKREEPQKSMLDSMADQLRLMLKSWKGLDPDDVSLIPAWTWDIVRRYDREFFSPAMKEDLPFAATVMFRKR
ncbi:MAG: class I SAM-dependent methyltransferase [Janthinobacterium lividum]